VANTVANTAGSVQDGLCCGPLRGEVLSEEDAAELASVFKALADPVRLRIVSLVASAAGGELCACDLPETLDRSQPTVSHHLSQLVTAGMLEREQRGKWAWFRLRPERLAANASLARHLRLITVIKRLAHPSLSD
jgi:ArsR family transcriptional regulator